MNILILNNNNNNNNNLIILSNGCVGFGVTSPSSKLHIVNILEERKKKLDKIYDKIKKKSIK